MIPVNIPAFSTLLSALSTEFNYPCCKYYEKFPFNPNLVATEDQCHLGLSCFHRHYFDNLCMKTSLKRKSKNSHDHELQRVPTRVGLLCNLYSVAWHSFSNSKRLPTVVVYVCYTVLHRATQGYTVLQCFSATATGESR